MLVLTRKLKEQIRVGNDITITILRVSGKSVRVGIEAPREVRVIRAELPELEDAVAVEVETHAAATRRAARLAGTNRLVRKSRVETDAEAAATRSSSRRPRNSRAEEVDALLEGSCSDRRPLDSTRSASFGSASASATMRADGPAPLAQHVLMGRRG